ncbi:membrane protein ORF66 [Anguillid herpesvirus 1]|uniref:Membrane protein ORF66 n=1 Tax=Anguillid herpesvirus 1 TaxID=150286 RepID=A0A1J0REF8_9VIRU|nr:membrane protein ORF66 [Anguillid herpesvirus 1]ADA57829.1 membrane protein ORF66 [Anguillid herpesvirus 1]APD76229.1 membrane protein ORF66 [Anguillid herpesvirus 1]QRM16360.1 membrane protein ORF66 [Anguillid herpesvirus 1]QRM16619.1 membrane protein ORF66 [Anguillid herpesvirus 1]QRM16883.1 membrane protein ORF66 [Anguillid herpesvirus 1]
MNTLHILVVFVCLGAICQASIFSSSKKRPSYVSVAYKGTQRQVDLNSKMKKVQDLKLAACSAFSVGTSTCKDFRLFSANTKIDDSSNIGSKFEYSLVDYAGKVTVPANRVTCPNGDIVGKTVTCVGSKSAGACLGKEACKCSATSPCVVAESDGTRVDKLPMCLLKEDIKKGVSFNVTSTTNFYTKIRDRAQPLIQQAKDYAKGKWSQNKDKWMNTALTQGYKFISSENGRLVCNRLGLPQSACDNMSEFAASPTGFMVRQGQRWLKLDAGAVSDQAINEMVEAFAPQAPEDPNSAISLIEGVVIQTKGDEEKETSNNKTYILIGAGVGALLLLIAIGGCIGCCVCCYLKKKKQAAPEPNLAQLQLALIAAAAGPPANIPTNPTGNGPDMV